MNRPRVTLNCVADHYHAAGERILEFHSDNLKMGGLISLIETADGNLRVEVYRADDGVYVLGPSKTNAPAPAKEES